MRADVKDCPGEYIENTTVGLSVLLQPSGLRRTRAALVKLRCRQHFSHLTRQRNRHRNIDWLFPPESIGPNGERDLAQHMQLERRHRQIGELPSGTLHHHPEYLDANDRFRNVVRLALVLNVATVKLPSFQCPRAYQLLEGLALELK